MSTIAMTSLELARWQFGIVTLYHFIFVPLTIGLAFFTAWYQTRWYRTKDEKWLRATRFWGKLMLISFALGVATGIVQEFQFGMNWSAYSRFVGDIFGAPLAMEGLAAFFVESTFLGLWIFGWGRLSEKVHLACMWAVSLSTMLSAFFILAANSWMQHPVGYELNQATNKVELKSIWDVLTNSTALYAMTHTMLAAALTGGMVIAGISAWHLLRKNEVEVFSSSMKIALPSLAVAGLLTLVVGHFNGILMSEQQPMKMAAADAVFETEDGVGLSLFATGKFEGNPEETNRNIKLPNALSFIMTGKPDSEVKGVNNLNEEYRQRFGDPASPEYRGPEFKTMDYAPIVWVAYWSWRVMLGCGFLLALFGVIGWWFNRKGKLPDSRRFLKLAMPAASLPFIAAAAGWIFTEMGRQPWVVFGLLRTQDANSPTVSATEVWISLVGMTLLYGVLAVFAGKIFFKTAGKGPAEIEEGEEDKPYLGMAY
ncbi:MAG TPA: cytochrome ubiquinol oxidase subunit I [Solirubrobacterales bacterium]|jgi:cytochrome d ubiquinol oxidase subunit I|nr:cytochrome ubiquinol oxidase subunit I [Solirubrobacterales bacterium]HMU27177.1 cytochrome ubiquinol oxidase subunit I [Solirubrobacterales bacterium]HMX70128.1 cytochrome ubiquinol oxidase subunit I [Solirubrobacterales bacterium]HMY26499.1 cytochrome ubiquinol oxidase subunit I [Solirubrobacterales bacterium]HNA23343.1 cytochrome ubiquinol oxidase subunit I [Solirubrobacterales bacterium]